MFWCSSSMDAEIIARQHTASRQQKASLRATVTGKL
jgi:hypothetical protein